MTIEVALVISILSLIFTVYQGASNLKRNQRTDERQDATQLTTVIVKLENISNGIADIKSDMRNVKDEVRELRDKLIKVDESTKSAHKRLDEFIRTHDVRIHEGGENNDE